MKPLRIGFLCNEYPPDPHGGIGSFVHDMAKALTKKGHSIFVIGYGSRKQKLKKNGVCIDIEPWPKEFSLSHLNAVHRRFRVARMLTKKSNRYGLDLIEAPDWKGEAAFYGGRVPLVTRIHGSTSILKQPSRLTHFFEKRQLLRSQTRVAVSNHAARLTQRAFQISSPIPVIPSGIDTDFFQPGDRSPNEHTYLFVGRFVQEKGSREALKYFEQICNRQPTATLQIVGYVPDDERDFAETSVPKHIRKAITFVGRIPREDILAYYQNSSCLLFFSKAEAFGLSVIEAMTCGCIPIVSKGTAATDLITDGVDGHIEDGSFHHERLMQSQDSIRLSARNAAIEKYSLSRSAEENIGLYRQLAGHDHE